jgi:uncharacterized protein (TIGR00269 family)
MFEKGAKVLVALSGGKDSLALMDVLVRLGHDVHGMHVHLGIPDASDTALRLTRDFCDRLNRPLTVVDLPSRGLAIPRVKEAVRRPVCSICGKLKRHFFNQAAVEVGADVLATGHNLDDETARLLANALRWDTSHLAAQAPALPAEDGFIRKVKPLYRLGEFETAAYAHLSGIDCAVAPCPYSTQASFTRHKMLLEQLEAVSPGARIQFYEQFQDKARQAFQGLDSAARPPLSPCSECGYPTPGDVCGACSLKARLGPR